MGGLDQKSSGRAFREGRAHTTEKWSSEDTGSVGRFVEGEGALPGRWGVCVHRELGGLITRPGLLGRNHLCVCFDQEGNVEQILESLRATTVYSCLCSEDLDQRGHRQSRCLIRVYWKVVWAGRSHAKEFRLEAASKEGLSSF